MSLKAEKFSYYQTERITYILKEEFEKYRKFHTDFPKNTVGYYLGGMKQEELRKLKDIIILGTLQNGYEGFDCREPPTLL